MTVRPGNNPKRRIAPDGRLSEAENLHLKSAVCYVGSGHHKRSPADYGLPRVNPRPTKSLCDFMRVISLAEARQLLARGIELGMFSEPREGGLPKFIWSVSAQGDVFEAKTDANSSGEYHGYPLEDEDVMSEYVKSVWMKRCR